MLIFNITNEINNPVHFNSVSNNGWLEVFLKGKFSPQFHFIIQNLSNIHKFLEKNYLEEKNQEKKPKSNKNVTKVYSHNEFVFSNIEKDPLYQNYKVKKIIFEANTFKNYLFKFDDHTIIGKYINNHHNSIVKYINKINFLILDTTGITRIEISRYEIDDKHVSVPIAIFSPID